MATTITYSENTTYAAACGCSTTYGPGTETVTVTDQHGWTGVNCTMAREIVGQVRCAACAAAEKMFRRQTPDEVEAFCAKLLASC